MSFAKFSQKNVRFLLLALTVFFSSCSCNKEKKNKQLVSDLEKEIGYKVKSMIVVGFRDEDLDYILKQNKAGGYIFFVKDLITKEPRNAYSKDILEQNIKKIKDAGIKFISVDQEGGPVLNKDGKLIDPKYRAVNRLYHIEDFNKMLFPEDLANITSEKRAKLVNYYAKKMKNIGFSVNFVPTVDLKINKDPDFFLNRAHRLFSDKLEIVSNVAGDVIDIYNKNGLLTSAKHFPGHGSATTDSHKGFTDITKTWDEIELKPYIDLIKKDKIDMVMVGHLFNEKLDKKYPSSLSYNTINGLLREKLKYRGVVISDSIDMGALTSAYTLSEIVINSINAGTDIVLHANQIIYDKDIAEKIYNIIIKAVLDGKISKEKINQSYNRIGNLLNNRVQEKMIEPLLIKTKNLKLHDRIKYFSEYFLGLPYAKKGNEDLAYKLAELDCVTYFNAVMSASLSKDLKDMREILHKRHFFTLDNLAKNSRFENITSKIFKDSKIYSFLIDKKGFFDYVFKIKTEDSPERIEINYMDVNLLNNDDLLKIKDGVYVITLSYGKNGDIKDASGNIISENDGNHLGFLIKEGKKLIMRHATSAFPEKVVEINFIDYLNNFKNKKTNGRFAIWEISVR